MADDEQDDEGRWLFMFRKAALGYDPMGHDASVLEALGKKSTTLKIKIPTSAFTTSDKQCVKCTSPMQNGSYKSSTALSKLKQNRRK